MNPFWIQKRPQNHEKSSSEASLEIIYFLASKKVRKWAPFGSLLAPLAPKMDSHHWSFASWGPSFVPLGAQSGPRDPRDLKKEPLGPPRGQKGAPGVPKVSPQAPKMVPKAWKMSPQGWCFHVFGFLHRKRRYFWPLCLDTSARPGGMREAIK